jgi:phosphoglycerate dehydrogenase-like enzyme
MGAGIRAVFAKRLLDAAPEWLPDALESYEVVGAADAALRSELAHADAFVGMSLRRRHTAKATRLRLVQSFSAGSDDIDVRALPSGCVFCNVRGHEQTVAEWVLMAAVAVQRRLLSHDRQLRRGVWHHGWDEPGVDPDLGERTLGAVGFGAIGERVTRLASCLGMRTLAVTRSPSAGRAVAVDRLGPLDGLRNLCEESDVVVVCVPLRPETDGLVGRLELEAIGPEGILVNVARGPVVQERALYEALRDGRLGGAALDVWYRYPKRGKTTWPATHPFWELENVVMTPHVAGSSAGAYRRRWEFVVAQLRRLGAGEPLLNAVATGTGHAD